MLWKLLWGLYGTFPKTQVKAEARERSSQLLPREFSCTENHKNVSVAHLTEKVLETLGLMCLTLVELDWCLTEARGWWDQQPAF